MRKKKKAGRPLVLFLLIAAVALSFSVGTLAGAQSGSQFHNPSEIPAGEFADGSYTFKSKLLFDLRGKTGSAGTDAIDILTDTGNFGVLRVNKPAFKFWDTDGGKRASLDFENADVFGKVNLPKDGGSDTPRLSVETGGTGLDIFGAGASPNRLVTIYDTLKVNKLEVQNDLTARQDGHLFYLIRRPLGIGVEQPDRFHLIAEQFYAIRSGRSVWKNIDNAAPNTELPRCLNHIGTLEAQIDACLQQRLEFDKIAGCDLNGRSGQRSRR